ncbi:hypothetical protein [Aminobacterium sp. EBM-42]|jgi:hypothetical protein|uniref:hypothetical protein n=1 Tax=Aminobacterium sp. EBM-42 TaxID=1918503 RepID=UPI00257F9665|nr:hypothetical protein [Aminobacterium sp. EBM-42]
MFSNKQLNVFLIIMAILITFGAVWLTYSAFKAPPVPEVAQHTDLQAQKIQKEIEALGKRINDLEAATKKEVRVIREKTIKEISVLPPNDICSELNRELSKFRMAIRSEGLDDF